MADDDDELFGIKNHHQEFGSRHCSKQQLAFDIYRVLTDQITQLSTWQHST